MVPLTKPLLWTFKKGICNIYSQEQSQMWIQVSVEQVSSPYIDHSFNWYIHIKESELKWKQGRTKRSPGSSTYQICTAR